MHRPRLYAKIEGYITKIESVEFKGLVSQAFAFALQEELHDYYRLLAVLEQELSRTPGPEPATVGAAESNLEDEMNMSSSGLTLLRLRAW